MIWLLFETIFTLVVIALTLGFLRSSQLEHSAKQAVFLKGKIPNPPPEGLYAGKVSIKTPWLGKKFNADSSTGINLFDVHDDQVEKYPFITSVGSGSRDATLQVFKIDYNIPSNPFWMHPILDEIVELEPGHYLGKMHVRIIPRHPFTLAYFELEK